MKPCHRCGEEKTPGPGSRYCASCRIESAEEVRQRRNTLVREQRRQGIGCSANTRWNTFKYKYGITREDFEAMLDAQDYCCALCGRGFGDEAGQPVMDHNHNTKKPREILCHRCNMGLGYFDDDPTKLLDAAVYLLRYQEVPCPNLS